MREKSPLGEDGCSSAARLVFVARAAGRYAVHTGLESASRPASPVISPPPRREPVTVRSSLVCASACHTAPRLREARNVCSNKCPPEVSMEGW